MLAIIYSILASTILLLLLLLLLPLLLFLVLLTILLAHQDQPSFSISMISIDMIHHQHDSTPYDIWRYTTTTSTIIVRVCIFLTLCDSFLTPLLTLHFFTSSLYGYQLTLRFLQKEFLMFWQEYLWSQNNESELFYSGKIHSRNVGKIKG